MNDLQKDRLEGQGDTSGLYRSIPSVSELLSKDEISNLFKVYSRERVVDAVRRVTDILRDKIAEGLIREKFSVNSVIEMTRDVLSKSYDKNLVRVINATGTVLHTNLGRAPLSGEAIDAVAEVSAGYSNLEFDLEKGKRGSRHSHIQRLIPEITGAEDGMIVNNNAAAVMLMLETFGRGGETVVSRGELVEIGGAFRMPDIMALSGTTMVEVGTTNRTHATDFRTAITPDTKVLFKANKSNFEMNGFTAEVPVEGLVEIARENDLLVIYDEGSGFIGYPGHSLPMDGITRHGHVTVREAVSAGVDLVSFSGDKMLGGPQAGIIAGRKELLDQLRKNQFARVIRVDKMCIAAMEATLTAHLGMFGGIKSIPAWRMLGMEPEELRRRAEELVEVISDKIDASEFTIDVIEGNSAVGGGSFPGAELPTYLTRIQPVSESIDVSRFAGQLLHNSPPILVMVRKNSILLDPRTLSTEDYNLIADAFELVTGNPPKAGEK